MATSADIGYGARFAIWDASLTTPAFVDLAEVTDITPPSDSVDLIDATHMASPDGRREFIAGLSDPGECSIEMNFVASSPADTRLRALRASRAAVQCRITFPNAATWTFDGILTGYEVTVPVADKQTASVTFKVTGSVVVA